MERWCVGVDRGVSEESAGGKASDRLHCLECTAHVGSQVVGLGDCCMPSAKSWLQCLHRCELVRSLRWQIKRRWCAREGSEMAADHDSDKRGRENAGNMYNDKSVSEKLVLMVEKSCG